MTDNTSNLWDHVAAIDTNIQRRWGGNDVLGGYDLDMTVSNWPISVRPSGSNDVFDYFLIQLQGKAYLKGGRQHSGQIRGPDDMEDLISGRRSPEGFSNFEVNAYGIIIGLPGGVQLIDSSPDTTIATTSYTTSVSTTVGGSFGFFGDDATGSVSASQTISHSTTQNVSDLRIMNEEDQNTIVYLIARDSLMSQSEAPLCAQFLVKRPHSSAALDVQFIFRAYFSGGNRGDWLCKLNWGGVDEWTAGFTNATHPDEMPEYVRDSGAVDYLAKVSLTAPPPPRS